MEAKTLSRLAFGLLSLHIASLLPCAALADALDTTLTVRVTSVDAGVDSITVGDVFFLEFTVEDSVVDTNASVGAGKFPGLVTSFSMSASPSNNGSWTPSGAFDLAGSNFVNNAFGDSITFQLRGTGFPDGGSSLTFHDIDLGFNWPTDVTDSGLGDTFSQQLSPASFGVPPAILMLSVGIRFTDGFDFPTAFFMPVPSQVALTYRIEPVNLVVSGATFEGTVTTDGTLGSLAPANLVDWSVDVSGPLDFTITPANSALNSTVFSMVSASETEIRVAFPDGVFQFNLIGPFTTTVPECSSCFEGAVQLFRSDFERNIQGLDLHDEDDSDPSINDFQGPVVAENETSYLAATIVPEPSPRLLGIAAIAAIALLTRLRRRF